MKRFLAFVLVVVALGWVTRDALDVGFLADDWYLAERIAADRVDHPGIFDRVVRSVTNTWSPTFEVFRPLTILSIELDWSLFGDEAGLHHLQSIFLWALLCWLLSGVVLRLADVEGLGKRVVIAVWFGCWPACVEAVAWLVARQDLFVGIGAVIMLSALVRRREDRFGPVFGLCVALLAKETAVVLPFLHVFADRLLHGANPGVGVGKEWTERLKRTLPLFVVLASYFGIRMLVFGRIGGAYNGRSPGEHLSDRDGLFAILAAAVESGLHVLTPLNAAMAEPRRLFGSDAPSGGVPLAARVVCGATFGLIVLVGAMTAAIRGPGKTTFKARFALFALFAVLPTILLTMTGSRVTPELTQSRFLVLPFVGLALAVGPSTATLIDARRFVVWVIALAAMMGAVLWRNNLDPYRHASARTRSIADAALRGVTPGSTVWIDGWFLDDPAGSMVPKTEVNICAGAYVFGGAIGSVGRPPFVAPPGVHVRLVTPDSARHEPGVPSPLCAALTGGSAPPIFKRLEIADGEPFLRDVVPPMGALVLHDATPTQGDALRRDRSPSFAFGLDLPPGIDAVGIRVVVPSGEAAVADIPVAPGMKRDGGRLDLDVPGALFAIVAGERVLDHPLDASILGAVRQDVLFWWVELIADDAVVKTSTARAVRLR